MPLSAAVWKNAPLTWSSQASSAATADAAGELERGLIFPTGLLNTGDTELAEPITKEEAAQQRAEERAAKEAAKKQAAEAAAARAAEKEAARKAAAEEAATVSYTHLTLPTILLV
eukprot:3269306-Pleurochrysis_carterae.AAC.1